jgi:dATP/dGTP diphosphohydrolase
MSSDEKSVGDHFGAVISPAPPMTSNAPAPLGTNPKDLLGIKKVQLNLVPASSIIYQALAMEDGAVKYGPFNWRQNKVIASIYLAAAMRHLQSWQDGEELASDSQKPHLAHALACIGIIVDAKETGNLKDDRPLPGAASKLIAQWEKGTKK